MSTPFTHKLRLALSKCGEITRLPLAVDDPLTGSPNPEWGAARSAEAQAAGNRLMAALLLWVKVAEGTPPRHLAGEPNPTARATLAVASAAAHLERLLEPWAGPGGEASDSWPARLLEVARVIPFARRTDTRSWATADGWSARPPHGPTFEMAFTMVSAI